ncbi:cytochrome P450 [Durotheca rogersii]|uniref:cytochrome P450 n=1 Tax=Durotheca rogersii TaxID=419775 RepID=UPI002221191B|nr:cytochrome P450 [Durotheca rogersii]KAI5865352.1 cytochrome P450 [Durotheca rogersii]
MHSTSYTVQNLLLDLASSDPSLGYIQALREEAARVLNEAGGSWTRQSVQKLKLIDSTIRESMRLIPFNSVGLLRTVMDPYGIEVQQGNTTLNIPRGTILTIPVEAIHHDEAVYKNADAFYPFRFAQPGAIRDIIDATNETTCEASEVAGKPAEGGKQKTSATIDDAFLGFGFGKHACPGRFFALNEIKIFVAYMVLHYDIQHITTPRQKMTPLIWLNVPLFKELKVNIRKREPVELLHTSL